MPAIVLVYVTRVACVGEVSSCCHNTHVGVPPMRTVVLRREGQWPAFEWVNYAETLL